MKINDVPHGSAVMVRVTALNVVSEGDDVMLGVRCWVGENGAVIPYNEKLQLLRKELNESIGNESVLIKQDKPEL